MFCELGFVRRRWKSISRWLREQGAADFRMLLNLLLRLFCGLSADGGEDVRGASQAARVGGDGHVEFTFAK
jgi:hypothetical protein